MDIQTGIHAVELKRRLDQLGLPRQAAADRLGLSLQGLFKQLSGLRRVSRQTWKREHARSALKDFLAHFKWLS
jgi:hypothetical protein